MQPLATWFITSTWRRLELLINSRNSRGRFGGFIHAVVDMVFDEFFLGIADGFLYGMQLLRQVQTRTAGLQHVDHRREVSMGALQPGRYLGKLMHQKCSISVYPIPLERIRQGGNVLPVRASAPGPVLAQCEDSREDRERHQAAVSSSAWCWVNTLHTAGGMERKGSHCSGKTSRGP